VKLRPHKGGGISGQQRRSRPISRYAEEWRLLRSPEASGTRQRNGEVAKCAFIINLQGGATYELLINVYQRDVTNI